MILLNKCWRSSYWHELWLRESRYIMSVQQLDTICDTLIDLSIAEHIVNHQETCLTHRVYRERERLQCFSQPASLITYRRRQRSNVENIKTVQNELENLHMILLCKKGSHGVCVRGKQRSIPLPNCLESWTLKNHVQFICNSHTTTMCADPIGSGNMLTPSKTPENNWQLMRAQPKL